MSIGTRRWPSGETTSSSKKTKVVLPGSSCPVYSAGMKEEPDQGGIAHGGAGTAVAEEASQALERPRINISVDVQLLHCAVPECRRPLKPPVVKCETRHLLCGACHDGGHCRKCDRATAFAHCGPELDLVIGDARVPCPFKSYGCGASIVYHATAAHQDACAYAPCHCAVPGCPFTATLPRLRDHLAVDYAWPLDTLPAYGKALPLRVPSRSRRRRRSRSRSRLLVVDGDERSLFALTVRPCGGAASCAVSVSCVRTSAAAEAGPRFTYVLWARSPAAAPGSGMAPGSASRHLMMEADVASCAVPGGAAVEEGMALYVPPPMLSGPPNSKEMHLRVSINVVDSAPAPQRSACSSSPRV
ncbi:hypothetical protein BDA96_03G095300 [Sorghum bicolor]|uniref:SIAH-type domain-containing protein n=1 Tax=Sorghum bicolor TaxID=4558 RepID=A0A921UM75_SORBI|nr:hypothetical protein BDA96_03G095300 [Sorghum bicolor]